MGGRGSSSRTAAGGLGLSSTEIAMVANTMSHVRDMRNNGWDEGDDMSRMLLNLEERKLALLESGMAKRLVNTDEYFFLYDHNIIPEVYASSGDNPIERVEIMPDWVLPNSDMGRRVTNAFDSLERMGFSNEDVAAVLRSMGYFMKLMDGDFE